MPALTEKYTKINLSLSYDGITIYPKYEEFKQVEQIIKIGCRQVIMHGLIKTEESKSGAESFKKIEKSSSYDRYVFFKDKNHPLYHQDTFLESEEHTHIKFKSLISREQLLQMLTIFEEHGLISTDEKNNFIWKYDTRYALIKKEIDQILFHISENETVVKKVIQYIEKCNDNDKLAYLHQYIASVSEIRFPPPANNEAASTRWQAINAHGELAPANKSWANIEKSILLQMAHNIKVQSGKNYKHIASEQAKHLKNKYLFDEKRKITKPVQISKNYRAFHHNPKEKQTSSAYRTFHEAKKNEHGKKYEFDEIYKRNIRKYK